MEVKRGVPVNTFIKRIVRGAFGVIGIALLVGGFFVFDAQPAYAADGDDYFWAGNSGNWSDVGHWSSTDDGTGGDYATPPNATNDVFFATQAFTLAGQTVTVDAAASCKDMIWTGATNTPTFARGEVNLLTAYGDVTTIASMAMTGSRTMVIRTINGDRTLDTGGLVWSCGVQKQDANKLTLLSAFNNGANIFQPVAGELISGNFAITCGVFGDGSSVSAKTITIGSSIITCTGISFANAGLTVTANTATINCAGNFTSAGYNYNGATLNLTGATSTITGSNTFNTLGLTREGAQTITFTDGTTQTVTNFTRNVGTQVKTLQGSGVAGWAITKAGGGTAYMDYISVSRSTASPAATFIAGANSTNGGNNVDWTFVADATTGAESNVTFGAATLNGTVTTNGNNATRRGFQYGLVSGALNLDVHADGDFGTGAYSFNIVGLSQNETYYYRAYAVTAGITEYGVEGSLTTQPTAWGIMMLLPLIVAIGVVIIGLRAFSSSGMQGYAVSVLFGIATYIMLQALIGIL